LIDQLLSHTDELIITSMNLEKRYISPKIKSKKIDGTEKMQTRTD